MRHFHIAVLTGCLAMSAAADFTLKNTLDGIAFDWSDGDSYVGDVAPSGDDAYVCIPPGMFASVAIAIVWHGLAAGAPAGAPEASWNDRVVAYLLDCGITQSEIERFREIMLERP